MKVNCRTTQSQSPPPQVTLALCSGRHRHICPLAQGQLYRKVGTATGTDQVFPFWDPTLAPPPAPPMNIYWPQCPPGKTVLWASPLGRGQIPENRGCALRVLPASHPGCYPHSQRSLPSSQPICACPILVRMFVLPTSPGIIKHSAVETQPVTWQARPANLGTSLIPFVFLT